MWALLAVWHEALQRFLETLSVSGASGLVALLSGIQIKTGHAIGVGQSSASEGSLLLNGPVSLENNPPSSYLEAVSFRS